jgi:hypothetical protein
MLGYLWIPISLIITLPLAGCCGNLCWHYHENFLLSLAVFQLTFWMSLALCYRIKYSITKLLLQ